MDATRISDGKTVILKKLLEGEGPYELQINKLFSSDSLVSNPRNHCAPLLDVIELPNDPPIMVHSHLRPFYNPRFNTYGEFVAFFEQICEVCVPFSFVNTDCSQLSRAFNLCINIMSLIGNYSFTSSHTSC
jgi:hypothetical protein